MLKTMFESSRNITLNFTKEALHILVYLNNFTESEYRGKNRIRFTPHQLSVKCK